MAKPKIEQNRDQNGRVVELGEPREAVPLPSAAYPEVTVEEEVSPPPDGGVMQHPLHDSDTDDRTTEDFEQEIDNKERVIKHSTQPT
jgi:hypothetical protein